MTDSHNLVPAETLIPGIRWRELPPGYTTLEAMAVLKCLDEAGEVTYVTRYSPDVHSVEVLGMMTAGLAILKKQVVDDYLPDEEE